MTTSLMIQTPLPDAETRARLAVLLEQMRKLPERGDPELAHISADEFLCEALGLLGQKELIAAYDDVPKWYA